jgi:hypothetical protein
MAFVIGLELGQASEYTAIAVLEQALHEQRASWHYSIRHLKRWPLGTSYPQIVGEVTTLLTNQTPAGAPSQLIGARLVVDSTGVGSAVVELFRRELDWASEFSTVIVSGGHQVAFDKGHWNVAKKELVGTLQVLLQARRLRIAEELSHASILAKELLAFRAKVTPVGSEAVEAWREREHDDLVLAVALACWWGERHEPAGTEPLYLGGGWRRW